MTRQKLKSPAHQVQQRLSAAQSAANPGGGRTIKQQKGPAQGQLGWTR